MTASQVVLDSFQTRIGQLDKEQRFVFARPLLGHKAIVLVRRQTILHTSSQSGHRGVSSLQSRRIGLRCGYQKGICRFLRQIRDDRNRCLFHLLLHYRRIIMVTATIADMYAKQKDYETTISLDANGARRQVHREQTCWYARAHARSPRSAPVAAWRHVCATRTTIANAKRDGPSRRRRTRGTTAIGNCARLARRRATNRATRRCFFVITITTTVRSDFG